MHRFLSIDLYLIYGIMKFFWNKKNLSWYFGHIRPTHSSWEHAHISAAKILISHNGPKSHANPRIQALILGYFVMVLFDSEYIWICFKYIVLFHPIIYNYYFIIISDEQNIAQIVHTFGIGLSEPMARSSGLAPYKPKPEDRAFHSHHQAIFRCDLPVDFPFDWLGLAGKRSIHAFILPYYAV